jgi:hypothetical protein
LRGVFNPGGRVRQCGTDAAFGERLERQWCDLQFQLDRVSSAGNASSGSSTSGGATTGSPGTSASGSTSAGSTVVPMAVIAEGSEGTMRFSIPVQVGDSSPLDVFFDTGRHDKLPEETSTFPNGLPAWNDGLGHPSCVDDETSGTNYCEPGFFDTGAPATGVENWPGAPSISKLPSILS